MKSFIVLVGFLMLVGCGQQQGEITEDAFEYAKKYVWGDKINGCKYFTLQFSDHFTETIFYKENLKNKNTIDIIESTNDKKIYNKIKSKNYFEEIDKENKYFILKSRNSKAMIRYQLDGENLFLYGIFINEKWKYPSRNSATYPTDYMICS